MIRKDLPTATYSNYDVIFLSAAISANTNGMFPKHSLSLASIVDEDGSFVDGVTSSETASYFIVWIPNEMWGVEGLIASPDRGIAIRELLTIDGEETELVLDFVKLIRGSGNYTYLGVHAHSAVCVYGANVGDGANFQLRDWSWDHPPVLENPPNIADWTATSPGELNSHFTDRTELWSATSYAAPLSNVEIQPFYFLSGKTDGIFDFDETVDNLGGTAVGAQQSDLFAVSYKADSESSCAQLAFEPADIYNPIQLDQCKFEKDLGTVRYAVQSALEYIGQNQIEYDFSNTFTDFSPLRVSYDPIQPVAGSITDRTRVFINGGGLPEDKYHCLFNISVHEIGHCINGPGYGLRSWYGIQEGLADVFAFLVYRSPVWLR